MMWRWLTCFSAAVALHAGVVSGRVEIVGGKNAAGVVVWLEPLSGGAPKPATPRRATMLQKNKRFLPHVLAIQAGTIVDFPNQDPIFHNAFSNYSGQLFDIGLYKPGTSRAVPFTRPGIVRVFCNIHPNMSAVIAVVDGPWFSVTSADGAFRIDDVPAGEYRLKVFHERATPSTLTGLERNVAVGAAGAALPVLSVSEAGYIPTPHLNKHGEPYSPSSSDYKVLK